MSGDVFSNIKIRGMELPNRFVRSATHDASADNTGAVTDRSVHIYERLGEANIGLIISGYAYVSDHGQARDGQYGAHIDEMVPGLKRMAMAAHRGGGKVALQIAYTGMDSPHLRGKGIPSLVPSKIESSEFPHREMTGDDIEAIIRDFGTAAVRSREAGFDGVQLHGGHGYIFSQFLSPLTNQRTDGWGGTPENRWRFHVEVVKEMRRLVGHDFPLMIKLGIMDDELGGTELSDGIAAAKEMIAAGIDSIEVSFGFGAEQFLKRAGDGPWFRERAAALKRTVNVPVMIVGRIRSLDTAQSILDSGEADMISMCRPFLREPELVARWLAGDKRPSTCIDCFRCLNPLPGEDGSGELCRQDSDSGRCT
ncbi:NADH:flavin oxidoreductase [Chloroflexota bacterium]